MIINKITKLYNAQLGQQGSEETIQAHLDQENTDGWNLVFVEHMNGWYRFYWEKESE